MVEEIATLLATLLIAQAALLAATVYYLGRVRKVLRVWKTLVEKERGKPVKPRKRYVVFALACNGNTSRGMVEKHVENAFTAYYGRAVLAKASPQLVFMDEKARRGVYRVSHLYVKHLISLFTAPLEAGECKCLIIPLKTTGTLKKALKIMEKKK